MAIAERRLERLVEGRWPVCAALAVIATCWVTGRLGMWESAFGASFVVGATMLAPSRRALARGGRHLGSASAIAGPETLAVLSGLPDPILVLDRRGVVLAFNEHARVALGEIRIGDPVSFSLRAPEVIDAVRSAPSSPEPKVVLYTERVPVERWREAHVASARVGVDGPGAIIVALRDLTEQRRSERMRGDFVANASHELRTPLASLLGFIETLQGPARNDTDARDRFLDIMRAQANRMSRLIDDLLSLSRIELKAHVRPKTAVDLTALVRSVVDGIGPLARSRGVEIVITADDEPMLVEGDRDELIRVIENLVENAIKYGHVGKKIDVAVRGAAGRLGALLVVRDYGPGVAPEHLPRLTERFYRVDVADSRDKGGTGLGLALVKHIVQRHRGRLLIDSAAGEGATFTVALARAEKDEALAALELKQAG